MRYRLSRLLPDFIKRICLVKKTGTSLFLSLFLSALCLGTVSSFASSSTALDHPVSIDNKGKGQSYQVTQFRGKKRGNRSFGGNKRRVVRPSSVPRRQQVKSAPRNNQLRSAPRRQQVRPVIRRQQAKRAPRRQQARRAPRRQQVNRATRRRQQARSRVAKRRKTSYRRKARRRSAKRSRIIRAQRRLKRLRFYRGRIDGIAGRKTRRAIVRYKRRYGSTKRLYR